MTLSKTRFAIGDAVDKLRRIHHIKTRHEADTGNKVTVDFCHWSHHDDAEFVPFIVGDDGTLVRTDWNAFALFFNDSFESIDAGLEFWS